MTPVTMYVHHIIAQRTKSMFIAFYAAVMATDGAKPKMVQGWSEISNDNEDAAIEMKAAAQAIERLKTPCEVHVALKREILEAVAPGARKSAMLQHYLSQVTQPHKDRPTHLVTFEDFDPNSQSGLLMGSAMIAAIAAHDEWESTVRKEDDGE